MRSPRVDREVDVAQHVEIAVPLVHADDLDGDRRASSWRRLAVRACGRRPCVSPQRLSAGGEPALRSQRGVARHAVAEDEIEHRGERIAGALEVTGVAQFGSMRAASMVLQEIEDADDEHQRRVLEQADDRC